MIALSVVILLFLATVSAVFSMVFYLSWTQADAFNYADFDDTGDSL